MNLSNILLQSIFLLLPTQLGLHFWPSFTRISGIRIDYLSPTIYIIDIFLIVYILISLPQIIKFIKKKKKGAITLLAIILINLIFSQNISISLVWWSRSLLYIIFAISLKANKITVKQITTPLLLSTLFVISLEIFQFIRQSSVGGVFYYLGERQLSTSTPNVAKINIQNNLLLRPYSTFSHPNSLSGYLLLSLVLLSGIPLFFQILITIGLLLTFSKTAIFTLIIIFLLKIRTKLIIIISLLTTILLLTISPNNNYPTYITERLSQSKITLSIIKENPIFGIGYGNHISQVSKHLTSSQILPHYLQPVHNNLLLAVSEFGLIIPLLVILIIVKSKYYQRIKKKKLLLVLISIVVLTSSFDHYWYTLPQNRLLLLTSLALLL